MMTAGRIDFLRDFDDIGPDLLIAAGVSRLEAIVIVTAGRRMCDGYRQLSRQFPTRPKSFPSLCGTGARGVAHTMVAPNEAEIQKQGRATVRRFRSETGRQCHPYG